MAYKAYAGLGNEDATDDVLLQMGSIAKWLDDKGFTLRTQAIKNVSDAFEKYATKLERYLPWDHFNDKTSKEHHKVSEEAIDLATKIFPKLREQGKAVPKIMGCYSPILLGENLRDYVKFVIIWTPDGAELPNQINFKTTGRSSHVIRLAAMAKIPLFNLHKQDAEERIKNYVNGLEDEPELEINF